MSSLVGSTSTQSRVIRPLPKKWEPLVVSRKGVTEKWRVDDGDGSFMHSIDCTWVFDQGGPLLGYTSKKNPLCTEIYDIVADAELRGMMGPGAVASQLEHNAADMLVSTVGQHVRGDKMMTRFLANGSDACDAAVRLARAYTGYMEIISIGYHGSSIVFSHPPQGYGVPHKLTNLTHRVDWADSQRVTELMAGQRIGAIIVEVPSEDEDARSFLTHIRRQCDKYGTLMILDEVVTGFRLSLGGAAEFYGTEPDIACYGKAMSNGRGISAVVARDKIMEQLLDKVFYSNTFNGDPYNCAHIIGTLLTLDANSEELYPHIWAIGKELNDGLRDLGVSCKGHYPRTYVDQEGWLDTCKNLVGAGVVMHQPNYATFAHVSKHVKLTLKALEEIL